MNVKWRSSPRQDLKLTVQPSPNIPTTIKEAKRAPCVSSFEHRDPCACELWAMAESSSRSLTRAFSPPPVFFSELVLWSCDSEIDEKGWNLVWDWLSWVFVLEMAEVGKLLYVVVVDDVEGASSSSSSFRYTRPVLQSALQLMGCKARHAFKVFVG